jgi:hypothetical protein
MRGFGIDLLALQKINQPLKRVSAFHEKARAFHRAYWYAKCGAALWAPRRIGCCGLQFLLRFALLEF